MPLPGLSPASSGLIVPMTLVEAPALLSSRSKSPALSVLVDRLDDPVNLRITADSLVLRVDEDDLKVLVGGVLVDPVGVCRPVPIRTSDSFAEDGGGKTHSTLSDWHSGVRHAPPQSTAASAGT